MYVHIAVIQQVLYEKCLCTILAGICIIHLVSLLVSLVEVTGILVASRTFAYCFMNVVHFVVAPPSHPSGGGGKLLLTHKNRLGALLGSSRGYILPAGVG